MIRRKKYDELYHRLEKAKKQLAKAKRERTAYKLSLENCEREREELREIIKEVLVEAIVGRDIMLNPGNKPTSFVALKFTNIIGMLETLEAARGEK